MNFNELCEEHPQAILMDGYDDCIIGVLSSESVIVYDYDKVINKLMTVSEMTYAEAIDFHLYNQAGAYVGENTPIFIKLLD